MDHSDFVILLSRQRSGTNALRSVLKHHPDIFHVPEVFDNRMSDDWDIVAGSFNVRAIEATWFRFLERHAQGRLRPVLLAEEDESLFLDFLQYLRCFTDKRYLTIDIKYMSTHHITKAWRFISEEPYLFTLLKKHGLRVLNLTRRNYLRYYLSEAKAQQAQIWHEFDESVVGQQHWYLNSKQQTAKTREQRISVNVADMLHSLRLCRAENDIVESSFADYDRLLTFDYDDMFETIGAPIASSVLERVASWLGVEPCFAQKKPEYKKLSSLSLRETIENYSEVAEALAGTEFEYCLQDERMYSQHAIPTQNTTQ